MEPGLRPGFPLVCYKREVFFKCDLQATTCKDDDNIEWMVESQRCGIRVNSASRAADAGDYKCILGVFGDEESMASTEKFVLDITVPSSIQFAPVSEDSPVDFTSEQTVAVEAGTDVEFACQVISIELNYKCSFCITLLLNSDIWRSP